MLQRKNCPFLSTLSKRKAEERKKERKISISKNKKKETILGKKRFNLKVNLVSIAGD